MENLYTTSVYSGMLSAMSTCLSFLLAIMLSLNAAYAASVGVCDVLEHTSSQTAHLGHHSHEHSDEHIYDVPQVGAVDVDKVTSISDHHHDHVHPSFLYLLTEMIGVLPLTAGNALAVVTSNIFISVSLSRLERPPRAALA